MSIDIDPKKLKLIAGQAVQPMIKAILAGDLTPTQARSVLHQLGDNLYLQSAAHGLVDRDQQFLERRAALTNGS